MRPRLVAVALAGSLRLDWEMARRGYRRYAAYPAATLAGLFTNTVFGFMRASVLLALYADRQTVGGYDATASLTYTWLTQGLIATVAIWGWQELALRIRSGDIAIDLVRPIHPIRAGLGFDLGRAVYHGIFRGIPPVLVGAVAFRLTAPSDPLIWVAFLVSVALAVVVSYAFRALYNIAAFWTIDNRGVMLLSLILANLFSGFIVPIQFFPPWLAQIARGTPFPAMVQMPVDIFVGVTAGPDVVVALAVQAAWAAALLAVASGAFALGTRRLVVQGG